MEGKATSLQVVLLLAVCCASKTKTKRVFPTRSRSLGACGGARLACVGDGDVWGLCVSIWRSRGEWCRSGAERASALMFLQAALLLLPQES